MGNVQTAASARDVLWRPTPGELVDIGRPHRSPLGQQRLQQAPRSALKGREKVLLGIFALVLHGAAAYWISQKPTPVLPVVPPEIPPMTIEFSQPAPPVVEPPPPVVEPPPPVVEPPPPVEDELAVKPPPPKPVPKPKPKPVPFKVPLDPNYKSGPGGPGGFIDGVTPPLELTMKLPPTPYARTGGEVIAAMLDKIGIKAKIENVEWAQWLSGVYKERAYDLTVIAHVEPLDFGNFARPGYYWNYESAKFNELWGKINATADRAQRDKLMAEAQKLVADDTVMAYLYQPTWITVAKAGVKGLAKDMPIFVNDLSILSWG